MKKPVFLDVNNGNVKVIETNGKFKEFYPLIDCRCVDITYLKIGGRCFEIACDGEALLKANPRVSVVDKNNESMLFGSLLIFKNAGEDDFVSVDDEDIQIIANNIITAINKETGDIYPVVWGCEYY